MRWFTAGIAILAAALFFLHVDQLPTLRAAVDIPWWVMAAMFFFAESYVVHFEFRRDAHSFTLGEIPLVIGLFVLSPAGLVLAQLCGLGVGLLRRRQSTTKLLFNLSNLWLSAGVAITIFHWFVDRDLVLGGRSFIAAGIAATAASMLGIATITAVIRLAGGTSGYKQWIHSVALGVIVTVTNTSLALIAVTILWFLPGAAWLMLGPSLGLFLAYLSYSSQREKHESLQALYESSRALHRVHDGEQALEDLLGRAAAMFKAELAEIVLFAATSDDLHVRARLETGSKLRLERLPELDAEGQMWSLVALDDRTLLASRPVEDRRLKAALDAHGLRDVMVAPLHAENDVIGTLMVANRMGEVSTFKEKDLKLFETLANNTSAFLENERLTNRLRSEAAEKEHQALHDSLTGLPNRALLHDRLNQSLATARRESSKVAVLLIDLDGFREVNDTLGHHNGDLLLREVATRIEDVLRTSDVAARLGGDEFAVLLNGLRTEEDAEYIARQIINSLNAPTTIEGVNLEVRASIGIAVYPTHAVEANGLLQRADVAMYVAKDNHSGYEQYTHEKDRYSPNRLALAAELRRAIQDKELSVHYQPKVELRTGELIGVEALARWTHPTRGFIPPDEFIPVAEHTGLIKPLTLYVLDVALEQASRWKAAGIDIGVAVNLSARNLLDLELPDDIARLLLKAELPASNLVLEVTESFIMADPVRAKAVVDRLSAMGIVLAIDDFGTGYSSLAYLKRLPIRELKVDRSFVMGMVDDDNDAVIVRSTVELGRNLGLRVVAEGVETLGVWNRLAELGCDIAQGYFLSRPLPAEGLTDWAMARRIELDSRRTAAV